MRVMRVRRRVLGVALAVGLLLGGAVAVEALEGGLFASAELNPCAAKTKNPCNPCGARNPCNPCGGARVDAKRFKQPGGVKLAAGENLVAQGQELWNDRTLGKSGLACANCHVDNYMQMQPTFGEPYPHYVAMPAEQGGVDEVNAAEMVQFCMLVPMATDPLAWESTELAALAAYVEDIRPGYKPAGAANPCNPCGKRNPCNPCGAKNPCNPCGR